MASSWYMRAAPAGDARSEHEMGNLRGTPPSGRASSTLASAERHKYAEFDPHSGPQVFDPIAEVPQIVVVSPEDEEENGATEHGSNAAFASSEPTASDGVRAHYRLRDCVLIRWIIRKPYLALAALTALIGLAAIAVLPPVLHNLYGNGPPEIGLLPTASTTFVTMAPSLMSSSMPALAPPTSTLTSTPASTPASPTSTSSAASAPSGLPTQCAQQSTWVNGVDFLGIPSTGGRAWPYKLLHTPDAASCCALCYDRFPEGCQGWAFLPWDDTPVPCNIVYGWNTTDRVSPACPDGHTPVSFGMDASHATSWGGAGPCGSFGADGGG